MRILFELPYPGYLRIYGSTIELLAERGHTVLVSYDKPGKRRDPAAALTESRDRVEVVPPIPAASRRHERGIAKLRLGTNYARYLDPAFAGSPYLRRRLDKDLPEGLSFLTRAPGDLRVVRPALRMLLELERLVPSDAGVERALAAHEPDAVVVTPLIGRSREGIRQTDTVKALVIVVLWIVLGLIWVLGNPRMRGTKLFHQPPPSEGKLAIPKPEETPLGPEVPAEA